jgi:Na+-driven multidrug efflux pump
MVTKRQLGLLFIVLGVGTAVAMFVVDLLGAGQFQGIGPAQRRALLAAGAAVLLGLSLLPLGNRPA